VAARKISWGSENVFNIDTHKVLSGFLKGIIKSLLILISFTLSIRDQAITVSNEDEDSPFIGSIQSCYISDWIRVHEKQGEVFGIKDFIILRLKVSLNIGSFISLELLFRKVQIERC